MRRRHSMPFGAEADNEGTLHFRLWAPAASRVALQLESESLFMPRVTDGWHALTNAQTRVGMPRYRYRIDDTLDIPDPASRFQPEDVCAASEVIVPEAWTWQDDAWRGRPWDEAVIYELHVGTFTPAGTFRGVIDRLDYLRDLGVTALELMPVGDFPGRWNWGYDGVLPFAPDSRYGRPEDLKALVQEAHARQLMVLLDVVYNHFGPEGNFLHHYAPQFFTDRHRTPWGAAINFDGEGSRVVRDFFIHNALYWLTEFHFDGLRLDAVHAIFDDSSEHILDELARAVRKGPGRERRIHLVLENDRNESHYLERTAEGETRAYSAQWNDDWHHAVHVLLTDERHGYYADYGDAPETMLARCLTQGFAYQGEVSSFRGGRARGETSAHLPATAFVSFLQNHDQIGNRALGERIAALTSAAALEAATLLLLLAPQPPFLFMGQEWGSRQPFCFFCDFGPELADKVRAGRRREFERFPQFRSQATHIPDPNSEATVRACVLDWDALRTPSGTRWFALHRDLLRLRQSEIVPRLSGYAKAAAKPLQPCGLQIEWQFADGARLMVVANLNARESRVEGTPHGRMIAETPADIEAQLARGIVPAWGVAWYLEKPAHA